MSDPDTPDAAGTTEEPTTDELAAPSTDTDPGDEPTADEGEPAPAGTVAPAADEPSHEAVGIGVIDYPDDDWDPVTGTRVEPRP